ncbi:unnamed protein product [Macrosiphum euphorbiae]|uniref:Zinc finger BED domain-containing protein 5 n=1 Tax=Macrosiphum euphorbiae TaxID=13131 RepID=A0AAV0WER5_9HEMI|nr:unnamed protein product [Macrosiphum euphorbiae]
MFGKEAAEQISNIPLSNDTVRRRIITMSEDIVKNVNEILQKDKEFALQLDESTDVSVLSTIRPRIEDLCSIRQSQVSH